MLEERLLQQGVPDCDVTVDSDNGSLSVHFTPPSESDELDLDAVFAEISRTGRLTFRDPDGGIVLEGSQVVNAAADVNRNAIPASYLIRLELTPEGRAAFAEATARLIGQQITVNMDEDELIAPTVHAVIDSDTCEITNLASLEEARNLAVLINSGALPYALDYKITK